MDNSPLVSVLFITYKRISLLRHSVCSFLQNTDYPNLELVVTDDGSPAETQKEIQELPFARMALSAKNRGLGANANAGLRHCTGKYILQLQDDWECCGRAHYLHDAVELMESHPGVGMVDFYGPQHPTEPRYRIKGSQAEWYWIPTLTNSGAPVPHVYSDCPHLKRKDLVNFLGYYKERCRMEECERDYDRRFNSQERFRAAFSPRYYNTAFVHLGEGASFRTGSRLRQLERFLTPLVRSTKKTNPDLYASAKSTYARGVALLYRLRILRS